MASKESRIISCIKHIIDAVLQATDGTQCDPESEVRGLSHVLVHNCADNQMQEDGCRCGRMDGWLDDSSRSL